LTGATVAVQSAKGEHASFTIAIVACCVPVVMSGEVKERERGEARDRRVEERGRKREIHPKEYELE
jgi:hypothetical protein